MCNTRRESVNKHLSLNPLEFGERRNSRVKEAIGLRESLLQALKTRRLKTSSRRLGILARSNLASHFSLFHVVVNGRFNLLVEVFTSLPRGIPFILLHAPARER